MLYQVKLSYDRVMEIANASDAYYIGEIYHHGRAIEAEIEKWAEQQFGVNTYIISNFHPNEGIWGSFLRPADAMLFKLTWA